MATPTSTSSFLNIGFPLFSSLLVLCLLSSKKAQASDGIEGSEILKSQHPQLHTHLVRLSSLVLSKTSVCQHPSNIYSKGTKGGASLRLVHGHGPCSSHHSNTASPTLAQTLTQDQHRVNSIQSRLSHHNHTSQIPFDPSLAATADIPAQSGISFDTFNYLVTVSIGTPKRDLSLAFDTGSDLTWTQCQPCSPPGSCYNQIQPIFNPSASKSYSAVPCASKLCISLMWAGKSPGCRNSTCVYAIEYGDKSYTIGFFGKERLELTQSDVVKSFVFGCGLKNKGLFGRVAGLLGLGRGKISIVSQTARKYGKVFSYCLPSSPRFTGHLTFGKSKHGSSLSNGSSSSVQFTPFVKEMKHPSFYFLQLTAIGVGGRKIPVGASVSALKGMIIDSGTVITRLPPATYRALRSAFQRQMAGYPRAEGFELLDTCYDFRGYEEVRVPKISMFFSGDVEVEIDSSGILISDDVERACLAFAGNSAATDIAIIGNFQQKTLDVVYDLAGGRLGFSAHGCK
ncbi:aspartyl protease family protein At5g10770-like [Malania oleifera]|uniref:aspartyl protease family protein At5g10770-like n=1 Tax=Malania oleifera TaxID=397392 RepID=UPI0025AE1090|nr:aspartyl protease family protein At5g10770-like [Malania oleifera]